MSEPYRSGCDVSVLIAGGGPVGLSLAIELSWRGISCLLVEQRDGSIPVSKMNLANIRVMEHCRRWGIEQEVRNAGWPKDYPMDFVLVTSMAGHLIGRFPHPSQQERQHSFTPSPFQRCPQAWFDPILARKAASYPTVALRYRCRLTSFEQEDDRIVADLLNLETGRRERVSARYLAACDGASSAIRDALGIGLSGNPVLDHNINVFFRAPDFLSAHDKGRAVNYFAMGPEGIYAVLSAVDGCDLWRLGVHVPQQTDETNFDAAGAIRKFMGAELRFEVISVLKWVRSEIVAEKMLAGRVFLAGDAAHQLTPNGGLGMNTGISDAVDLGWKLAATLEGWGGSGLLDSYELERLPVAQDVVAAATGYFKKLVTLPKGPEIAEAGPAGERLRQRIRQVCHETRAHFTHESEGMQLGYHYEDSPLVVPDGSAPPANDVAVYTPSARPGSRAPHAWLGAGRSILDLFGRGFVLLRFDQRIDAAPILGAARSRGVPCVLHDIRQPEIARLYERKLALVRPDGHVAWRADHVPADAADLIDQVRGAVPAIARWPRAGAVGARMAPNRERQM